MKAAKHTSRIFRKGLRLIYGFDKWHITPLDSKNYAIAIIHYLNKQESRKSIVEIGCGLGDILRNVQFQIKYGFDMDERVLKAARLLMLPQKAKVKSSFSRFSFPDQTFDGKHDAILLVNWIHHIEPKVLKERINVYFESKLTLGGVLILDTVADPAYRYNHDINFLTEGLKCAVTCLGEYECNRRVWAIKKD